MPFFDYIEHTVDKIQASDKSDLNLQATYMATGVYNKTYLKFIGRTLYKIDP